MQADKKTIHIQVQKFTEICHYKAFYEVDYLTVLFQPNALRHMTPLSPLLYSSL